MWEGIVFSTVRVLVFFDRSDDPLCLLLYAVKVYTTVPFLRKIVISLFIGREGLRKA